MVALDSSAILMYITAVWQKLRPGGRRRGGDRADLSIARLLALSSGRHVATAGQRLGGGGPPALREALPGGC